MQSRSIQIRELHFWLADTRRYRSGFKAASRSQRLPRRVAEVTHGSALFRAALIVQTYASRRLVTRRSADGYPPPCGEGRPSEAMRSIAKSEAGVGVPRAPSAWDPHPTALRAATLPTSRSFASRRGRESRSASGKRVECFNRKHHKRLARRSILRTYIARSASSSAAWPSISGASKATPAEAPAAT